jgi:transglutaminase-like putative cysteine protease
LPHGKNLPPLLFGFFLITLFWYAVSIWQSRYLPNRWLLFLLTLLGIGLLFSQLRGVFGRDAGTALIVVALGLKMLEIRSKRDAILITYLAFIVATSVFLYEQSILMAGYILLVSVLLLATLISLYAKQAPTPLAFKTASMIILQALPLAVVVFVFFPRLEAPRWMWLKDENKALSGLTNTLEPGSIGELSLSDALVFRVRFTGKIPPPQQRYWRGPVYSKTDGISWSAAKNDHPPSETAQLSGESYSYTILMEPQKESWVFALEMAESFDNTLRKNAFQQLLTSKPPDERAEYRITSRPVFNTGALSASERQTNLQLPANASVRQRALIEHLQGFAGHPEQFIRNLLQYFRTEQFYYTLTPPLMLQDPIDTFLFETRSGFCSHYATAFVYLLRIAGIPARVVGGYQGGEFNKVGGFLEVKQADAHAWAEAWLEHKGWVRFDPTAAIAPERIERGINVDLQVASGAVNFGTIVGQSDALNWLKRSRQLWQSLDYNWQRWVINYNTSNQNQFLQSLGITDIASLTQWLLGSVVLITLPLSWWLLKSKGPTVDKTLRLYQGFCAKLARVGIQIGKGEGAKDFAERAGKLRPDLSGQIDYITRIFMRLRYEAQAHESDFQNLKKAIQKFKA